jgi:site-specific recombinase XerD
MPKDDLLQLEPQEALEKYLAHRESDVSEATLYAHKSRLGHLVRWCEGEGIEALSELRPHHLQDYRLWRRNDGDLNDVTMNTQMSTLRVFLKWMQDYGAVPSELHEHVRIPERGDDTRDKVFSADRAGAILEYLDQFEYASTRHVLFSILWHTGIRIGAARALDVDDFHEEERYIELNHRPETGTPLKNRQTGERPIALDPKRTQLLADHIEARRPDVTDDHGRDPLLASEHGRPHTTVLRHWVYSVSHPCLYNGGDCPHGRDMEECDAARVKNRAYQCPSTFSPHDVRRSSITHFLSEDVPENKISERMDVTEAVLDDHYDKRDPERKMEQRRGFFE